MTWRRLEARSQRPGDSLVANAVALDRSAGDLAYIDHLVQPLQGSPLAADSTIEPTRQSRTLVVRPPSLDLNQTRVDKFESVEEPLDPGAGAGHQGSGGQLIQLLDPRPHLGHLLR